MITRTILLSFIVIAISCNSSDTKEPDANSRTAEKSPVDSLFTEVLEGHDVGMAKIKQVRNAVAQVKQSLDSLNKLPREKVDALYQKSLSDLQEELEYAEFAMFKWMEEFKTDTLKENTELRLKYLQSEKEKVTKVRDNILNSLQRADSLFKQ